MPSLIWIFLTGFVTGIALMMLIRKPVWSAEGELLLLDPETFDELIAEARAGKDTPLEA